MPLNYEIATIQNWAKSIHSAIAIQQKNSKFIEIQGLHAQILIS